MWQAGTYPNGGPLGRYPQSQKNIRDMAKLMRYAALPVSQYFLRITRTEPPQGPTCGFAFIRLDTDRYPHI